MMLCRNNNISDKVGRWNWELFLYLVFEDNWIYWDWVMFEFFFYGYCLIGWIKIWIFLRIYYLIFMTFLKSKNIKVLLFILLFADLCIWK